MFDEDVEDLRAMLLADQSAVVCTSIGHSDGGTVALLLAARSPELVVSVAVVAVHVRGDTRRWLHSARMGPPT